MNDKFNRTKWGAFFDAYDRRDFKAMARESHRRDIGENRNEEIRRILESSE